jgi:HK97 family phage major capsid protein
VARKPGIIIVMSNELNDDSMISLGNLIADELSWSMAFAEDTAGFNGTGLSATGGIVGVVESLSLAAGEPTTTSAGGIIVSANNTYAEITLKEMHLLVGTCPTYARTSAKWYCSPLVANTVLQALQTAAGGNATGNISAGGLLPFLGYPVVPVEVMPTAEANSQIPILFGDLSQASKLGDRMSRTISTSEHATVDGQNVWELDQLAIKGVERIDINVHDVGTTTAAGPMCGLQLLNS